MDDSEPPALPLLFAGVLVVLGITMLMLYFTAWCGRSEAEFCRGECEEYGRALLAGSNVQLL